MTTLFLHFSLGCGGALFVFWVCARLSGTRSYSLPFGVIFFGVACAVLARYLSPWATPVVLTFYTLVSVKELRQEMRDAEEWKLKNQQEDVGRG